MRRTMCSSDADPRALKASPGLSADILGLSVLYFYGYQGRSMIAARAPSAMPDNARELIGQVATVDGWPYRIVAVERQISGPVAQGEPIGLEIRPLSPEADGRA